jgi:hypothetical protein
MRSARTVAALGLAVAVWATAAACKGGGEGSRWALPELEKDLGWFPDSTQLIVGYPDWKRGPFGQLLQSGRLPCLASASSGLQHQYTAYRALGGESTAVVTGPTDRPAFEQCALDFATSAFGEAALDRTGEVTTIRGKGHTAYYAWPERGAGKVLVVDTDRERIEGFIRAGRTVQANQDLVAQLGAVMPTADTWFWAAGTVDLGTPLLGVASTGFRAQVDGGPSEAEREAHAAFAFADRATLDRARAALTALGQTLGAAARSMKLDASGTTLLVRVQVDSAAYRAWATLVTSKLAPGQPMRPAP